MYTIFFTEDCKPFTCDFNPIITSTIPIIGDKLQIRYHKIGNNNNGCVAVQITDIVMVDFSNNSFEVKVKLLEEI